MSQLIIKGLPSKFVTAMRTLFDVLDDNKSGSVSLSDIEHWWRKDRDEHGGVGSVPNGVIESLRFVLSKDVYKQEAQIPGMKTVRKSTENNFISRCDTLVFLPPPVRYQTFSPKTVRFWSSFASKIPQKSSFASSFR